MVLAGSLAAALSAAFSAPVRGNDVLNITLDKTSMLRFDAPMNSVIVGQAQIADVTMESRRLLLVTGKAMGETNLIILGQQGRQIASFDLIVTPETNRHVTIHRAADTIATYSCLPRCTVVKSPDGTELSTRAPGGGKDESILSESEAPAKGSQTSGSSPSVGTP